jgi:hypothetical protein
MTWWMWIAAGAMWMGFVALMIVLSLSGVDETVEAGLAQEPSDARVMVAVASSIIFAVPGFALIMVGLRRHRRTPGV